MGRVPLNKIRVQDNAQSESTGEASKQPDSNTDTVDATPPEHDATSPSDDVTTTSENQVVALYIWQPDGSDKVFNELKERLKIKTNKSIVQFFKRYAEQFWLANFKQISNSC